MRANLNSVLTRPPSNRNCRGCLPRSGRPHHAARAPAPPAFACSHLSQPAFPGSGVHGTSAAGASQQPMMTASSVSSKATSAWRSWTGNVTVCATETSSAWSSYSKRRTTARIATRRRSRPTLSCCSTCFQPTSFDELFGRLGYELAHETITHNVDYYDRRSSHGSTSCRVVHAWVLTRVLRSDTTEVFPLETRGPAT